MGNRWRILTHPFGQEKGVFLEIVSGKAYYVSRFLDPQLDLALGKKDIARAIGDLLTAVAVE